MTEEQERIVRLVVERAQQACRYASKHNTDRMDESEYRDGFEVACSVCEDAIERYVMRHMEADISGAQEVEKP